MFGGLFWCGFGYFFQWLIVESVIGGGNCDVFNRGDIFVNEVLENGGMFIIYWQNFCVVFSSGVVDKVVCCYKVFFIG